MKYNIVRFGDKYAIRRTKGFWIFKEVTYLDLKSNDHWWHRNSFWFTDCLGSEEAVTEVWDRMALGGTEEVIK